MCPLKEALIKKTKKNCRKLRFCRNSDFISGGREVDFRGCFSVKSQGIILVVEPYFSKVIGRKPLTLL